MTEPFYSADAVASGRIGSSSLTQICLDRIARLNPLLNAFTQVSPTALAEAEESDRRIMAGAPRSPIEGIPVAIKDNMLVAGMAATWGSAVFKDFIPEADELPVARLRRAGAVIIGKTNTPEFSARGYTDNAIFGTTRNPWQPALTPGGSSGGSASAVAAGMVPLALGTDGGGSTRRPAGHTGLVGLKPSIGRIARANGFLPLILDFEVVGPMGRSVADVRALTAVLSGADTSDPRSRFLPPLSEGSLQRPLRIAVVHQIGDSPVDPDIRSSISRAAENLRVLGHAVEATEFPFSIDAFGTIQGVVLNSGFSLLARQSAGRYAATQPEYREHALAGDGLSAADLFAALNQTAILRSAVGDFFKAFDVLMTPSTAAQPWPADDVYPTLIDGRPAGPRAHAIFTGWVNVSGHPAISIPVDPDGEGLPVGMQLIGDLGADELLLDLAATYEHAHPWTHRMPQILAE